MEDQVAASIALSESVSGLKASMASRKAVTRKYQEKAKPKPAGRLAGLVLKPPKRIGGNFLSPLSHTGQRGEIIQGAPGGSPGIRDPDFQVPRLQTTPSIAEGTSSFQAQDTARKSPGRREQEHNKRKSSSPLEKKRDVNDGQNTNNNSNRGAAKRPMARSHRPESQQHSTKAVGKKPASMREARLHAESAHPSFLHILEGDGVADPRARTDLTTAQTTEEYSNSSKPTVKTDMRMPNMGVDQPIVGKQANMTGQEVDPPSRKAAVLQHPTSPALLHQDESRLNGLLPYTLSLPQASEVPSPMLQSVTRPPVSMLAKPTLPTTKSNTFIGLMESVGGLPQVTKAAKATKCVKFKKTVELFGSPGETKLIKPMGPVGKTVDAIRPPELLKTVGPGKTADAVRPTGLKTPECLTPTGLVTPIGPDDAAEPNRPTVIATNATVSAGANESKGAVPHPVHIESGQVKNTKALDKNISEIGRAHV